MNFDNIVWTKKTYDDFIKYLYSIRDKKYDEFNRKIVMTNYETIGIKIPILRDIVKRIKNTDIDKFISFADDTNIYEVIIIEGFLISYIKEYELFEDKLLKYTTKIDSWGICDTVTSSFKIINKNKEKAYNLVNRFIKSKHVFTKRMGYVILLDYFVDEEYLNDIFVYIKNEKSEDYYVLMAIAWLLSVCYIKYEKETFKFLEETKLNDFILRKTISKINDSFRVSKESKIRVKELLKRTV